METTRTTASEKIATLRNRLAAVLGVLNDAGAEAHEACKTSNLDIIEACLDDAADALKRAKSLVDTLKLAVEE